MTIIQVKTHKLYIIKKRSNNKVSFVEFIFNSRQFKLMTTGAQLHGAIELWKSFEFGLDSPCLWVFLLSVLIFSIPAFKIFIKSVAHVHLTCSVNWFLSILHFVVVKHKLAPQDNLNDRWKRLCLVSRATARCVWILWVKSSYLLTCKITVSQFQCPVVYA